MLPKHPLQMVMATLWSLLFLLGLSGSVAASESADDAVRFRFESMLAGFPLVAAEQPLLAEPSLLAFYEDRQYELAWFDGNRLRPEARDLLRTIDRSAGEGLQPGDYHQQLIATLIGGLTPASPLDVQVDLDLLLSDAFLLLGSHLLSGKVDPVTLVPEWSANRPGQDMAPLLVQALEAGSVEAMLDTLRPSQKVYQRMRDELKRFADLRAEGAWEVIDSGPLIHPGKSDPRLPAIRARLKALGDHAKSELPQAPVPSTLNVEGESYDIELLAAVSRFQGRHGLATDGVIGSETITMLNVTPEQRLRQIGINMERWRWLPEQLGSPRVMVNIAASELQLMTEQGPAFKAPLAAGGACPTVPAFSDELRYVVFNPSWTVPPALLVKQELQKLSKPGQLEALGFKLYRGLGSSRREVEPASVDWTRVEEGGLPYQLVQEPGPQNVLGNVRLMFPNAFGAYLHDMPTGEPSNTFAEPFRLGCLRVGRALDLADLLLGKDQGWSRKFTRNGGEGKPATFHLSEPVPIHIQYLTAWSDENGLLQLRDDQQGRDQALAAALAHKP